MKKTGRGAEIRSYILSQVESHPRDLVNTVADLFEISRQSVNRHINLLIESGEILIDGKTRNRTYRLNEIRYSVELKIGENREEDRVWEQQIEPRLPQLPQNIFRICLYGFTEMYNNVVDHSGGTTVVVEVVISPLRVRMTLNDDGVGIFEKIKAAFNMDDHRQAILELSKGKLTTDPQKHSGQGIFFSSRVFDRFCIHSSHLYFSHEHDDDWLIESDSRSGRGTYVVMEMMRDSKTDLVQLFDRYAKPEEDDYSFSRTHVPLVLARYGSNDLISRSQARRVLARFENFKEVFLDFEKVEFIGQAFADEIFRVFHSNNPEINLVYVRANAQVTGMIRRAMGDDESPQQPDATKTAR